MSLVRPNAGVFSQVRQALPMYEWIKALHVIVVIAWMAGMLYLPRLFVYHCDAETGSKQSETFKTMEHRLLKAIMVPFFESQVTGAPALQRTATRRGYALRCVRGT